MAIDGNEVAGADQAGLLLRTTPEADHTVSLIGPTGDARTASVQLFASAPVSVTSYLQQLLARDASPLAEYLYAQVSQDPDTGLKLAQLAVRAAPDFGGAYVLEGQLLLANTVRAAGLAPLTPETVSEIVTLEAQGTTLGSGSAEVQAAAASVYLSLGDTSAAAAAGERAVSLDPGSAKAYAALGLAQLSSGDSVSATASLRKAVDLDPYNPAEYQALSQAYRAAGRAEAAAATEATLRSLRTTPASAGSAPLMVVLAVAVDFLAIGVVFLIRRGRRAAPRTPPVALAAGGGRTSPSGALVETLAVLGVWSALIPWVGPAFGYAPESVRRLELADHVAPGLILIVAAAVCLPALIEGRLENSRYFLPTCAAFLLSGLWMAAAHVPLLLQAARHIRSWNLALFHASAAFPTVLVAGLLVRRAFERPKSRAERAVLT